MKTLFLLRHAKSSWDDPALDDFDRPLSKRGRRDAPRIGALMAERGWLPELALVSPAQRTRDTWERVSSCLPGPVETRFEQSVYMAFADDILALLRDADASGPVIVVGHNPGLENLAAMIAGDGSDPQALARMRAKFPTAALARFEFRGPLAPATARLTHFVVPKDLAGD